MLLSFKLFIQQFKLSLEASQIEMDFELNKYQTQKNNVYCRCETKMILTYRLTLISLSNSARHLNTNFYDSRHK